MDGLVASLFCFPTAIFSVAIGIAVLYWLMVILGALDLDILHIGDHGGHGGHDHDAAGHHDGDHDSHAGHNPFAILEFLRVGQVPLTIILSVFTFLAWVVCVAASTLVRPHVPGWSWWLFGLLALVAAVILAFLGTGIVLAPLARVFSLSGQPVADDLVGKLVEVTSSTVDARFGTARHDRPSGEDLILQVTCEPQHAFKRGDQAVVMEYDRTAGTYRIAPLPHTRPGFLAEPAQNPPQSPPAQPQPPARNAQ